MRYLRWIVEKAKSALVWTAITAAVCGILSLLTSNSLLPSIVGMVINTVLIDSVMGGRINATQKHAEDYAKQNNEFFNVDFFSVFYRDSVQTRLKLLWVFIFPALSLTIPICNMLPDLMPEWLLRVCVALLLIFAGEMLWDCFLSLNNYQSRVTKLIQTRRKNIQILNNNNIPYDAQLFWGEYSEDERAIISEMNPFFDSVPNASQVVNRAQEAVQKKAEAKLQGVKLEQTKKVNLTESRSQSGSEQ